MSRADASQVWVTLGFFDGCEGRIVALDARDGSAREVLCHRPPPALQVEGKGFTGACRADGWLFVCGAAAVYRFDAGLTPRGALTSPDFNDLHGVTVAGERVFIVNTGLDAIDVFDRDGTFMGSHVFDMAWITARRRAGACPSHEAHDALLRRGWSGAGADDFTPAPLAGGYYGDGAGLPFARRRQRDHVHPNHVDWHDGRLYVTSLARRAVVELGAWRAVATVDAPPHDGRFVDGALWLTRVDGRVERRTDAGIERFDVAAASGLYGWCRGLWVAGDRVWVGFTAIHHPPRYHWDRVAPAATRTGVVCFDWRRGEVVARFDLSVAGRHPKVFALVEAA
ncbi:MAG: hypothetical protein H6703_07525 [Myxococcales bacterium]|nr:hypothetical protein [Myxococcales bacterium]